MPESKLSTRGQVVVPKSVRDHLGVSDGDLIDFVVLSDGTVVVKSRKRDVRELSGILKGKVKKGKVSVQEMNEAIEKAHRAV